MPDRTLWGEKPLKMESDLDCYRSLNFQFYTQIPIDFGQWIYLIWRIIIAYSPNFVLKNCWLARQLSTTTTKLMITIIIIL